MAIIIRNGNINNLAGQKAQPATSREHPAADIVEGEHVVVANGKAKKIRKQSQYLLDMLTIDDD